MKFTPLEIPDVLLVELEWREDERGGFSRSFCEREFREIGIPFSVAQCNLSRNRIAGTVRGMHYQDKPAPELKLVACVSGRIFDVAIDLRPDSPTYCRWLGIELSVDNGRALFVPAGFAHGFQTLTNEATVSYTMSEFYQPSLQRGVRWDDPAFGIRWPLDVRSISGRDTAYPDFRR